MQNLAYPDRTSQYAGDFFSLLSPLEASASPDHQALLFTLQTLSIGVDDGAFSRSDAIAKTTQALTEAGGTFSVDASLTPYSDHSVRVLGMLFGARIFEFTYDTASAEVSSISEDGKSLPFPMPLEKFSAWAKTEASK